MEPVLFIHGLYNGNYGLAAEEFFPGRAVLMPDLLGYGDYTETPAGEISLTAQVDHVKGLLDAAGFGRAHVVGHSIGGAVAVLLARRYPERVASMVDVEGNFTLKDAFWSAKIAAMSPAEVEALLADQCADPAAWLVSQGIEPTTECVATAQRTLSAQLSSTLQATARSVVQITGRPEYLDDVRAILDSGLPFHLLAGERSRGGWDVPGWVMERATSMHVQPRVGHMMMWEEPTAYLKLIASLIPAAATA